MKVLHIINGEHYSGAERVQDLLAQKLPLYEIDAYLACIKPNYFPERCMCDKNKLLEYPMKSRLDISQAFSIKKYIKSNNVKLIHTHTPRTAIIGYIVSKMAGIPLVHHVHSPTSRDTENSRRNTYNTIAENFVIRRAQRVIAVSDSLRKYLLNMGISEDCVSVVHNGVPSIPVLPERKAPHKEWTLGVVALFRPRKGIEILLESLRHLVKDDEMPVRLRAVGEFETEQYKREIIARSESLDISGQIDWVGFSNDIQGELCKIDIFVLPSLYGEGLPMVILEAMANGVPIIGTKVEGVPEAIPSEDYGILVEPGDAESLAKAVKRLIKENGLWEQLRNKAYHHQKQSLSDDVMAEKLATIYKEIVSA
jgi:glycosyltransferase involved in cell wall biosynthesis